MKWWAKCLELVREMSFPVVAALTVVDNFPFIFHEGFQENINFYMVSIGVMIKVPCEWIKDHLVISQVLFFISENWSIKWSLKYLIDHLFRDSYRKFDEARIEKIDFFWKNWQNILDPPLKIKTPLICATSNFFLKK